MLTTHNAADWHAAQAIKAYRKKKPDYASYRRHIRIADDLRYIVDVVSRSERFAAEYVVVS